MMRCAIFGVVFAMMLGLAGCNGVPVVGGDTDAAAFIGGCTGGLVDCSGICRDLRTDRNHCGRDVRLDVRGGRDLLERRLRPVLPGWAHGVQRDLP
jgi:hypothetical protein